MEINTVSNNSRGKKKPKTINSRWLLKGKNAVECSESCVLGVLAMFKIYQSQINPPREDRNWPPQLIDGHDYGQAWLCFWTELIYNAMKSSCVCVGEGGGAWGAQPHAKQGVKEPNSMNGTEID